MALSRPRPSRPASPTRRRLRLPSAATAAATDPAIPSRAQLTGSGQLQGTIHHNSKIQKKVRPVSGIRVYVRCFVAATVDIMVIEIK